MCFCKSGILTSRPACIYEASHDQVQSGNTTKHIKIIQNQNYTKIQCLIISLRFLQSCNYTVLLTVPAGVGWVHIHLFAVWKPTPTKLSPSTRNNSSLLRLDHFLKSLHDQSQPGMERDQKKAKYTKHRYRFWNDLDQHLVGLTSQKILPHLEEIMNTHHIEAECNFSPWSWIHTEAIKNS